MKLEVEKNPPSVHPNGNATKLNDVSSASTDHSELLNHGIRSAQAGNRAEARVALFKVTENDPRNETAWLWLASISEYPEELLVFLNNVLEINPDNERAREWKTATNSLLAKTFVQRGIDAVEGDRKDFAAECFNRALEYDQNNEMAWLWMASLSDTNEGKINYLEMVLKINPDNEAATHAFKQAKGEIINSHLSAAKTAAALGQKTEANELLKAVIEEDPDCEDAWMLRSHFADTVEEKIESFKAVLVINPGNDAARFGMDSLRSLIGPSDTKETSNTEATIAIGSISSSKLFVYEPEIARNPTQDLEFPEEKLEELRDFEARVESELLPDGDYVEQPVSKPADQPVDGQVEQPVSLAEQGLSEPAEEIEPEIETVEFEVAPQEEHAEEMPEPVQEDEASFSAGAFEAENFVAENQDVNDLSVDADQTIDVSDGESYVSPESKTSEFTFEEDPSDELLKVEVDTSEFPFASATIDERTGPFWEPFVHDDSQPAVQTGDVVPETAFTEQIEDSTAAKTEEIPAGTDGFHSAQILIPAASEMDENIDEDADDPFKTVASITIPEYAIPEMEPETDPFESKAEPLYVRTPVTSPSSVICSFCDAVNEASSISCGSCLAVVTLSDLDTIIGNRHADRAVVQSAVERMEKDRQLRDYNEAELTMLGIGHLNLQNVQSGFNYLYEASRLNPNNVVLSSQVNALLIRLEDIRKHDENANAMAKGKTILVVDDSPTVRKLIAGKLEKSGHNVLCSADGVEAIHALGKVKPDLILLDINMPRMDGYQTCKSIRSNETTKDIPVVMISGKDGFFDKVRGRMAGTSGYITKPFGPETLMKTVETYLSGNVEEVSDRDAEIIDVEIEG
jgi:CheY-like chemotaxis protein/Tfp pilus assembly protein PilF